MRHIVKLLPGILYFLLAACMSMSVLAAATGYAMACRFSDSGFKSRVTCQLLRTRLHQGDIADAIHVTDPDSVSIRETYPEGVFLSAIYIHDGWLMEQLHAEGVLFDPAMGDRVVRLDALHTSYADGGLMFAMDGAHGFVRLRGINRTGGAGDGLSGN